MQRKATREFPPGTRVRAAGIYEQRNVLGSPTGTRITVAQGESLPSAPRGFTWVEVQTGAECAAED